MKRGMVIDMKKRMSREDHQAKLKAAMRRNWILAAASLMLALAAYFIFK